MAGQSDKKTAAVGVPEKHYFQTYYVEHRGEISQKRRQRYQTDPGYREEVKRRAMARYEDLRQKKKEEEERLRVELDQLTAQITKLRKEFKGKANPPKKVVDEIVGLQTKVEEITKALSSAVRSFNRPRVMQVSGNDVLVHCVSAFAERVGRDVQTITAWEEKGIIPKPTVVDEMGRRWYSEDHMDFIAALAHEYRASGRRDLSELKDMMDKEWSRHKGEDKNRG